MTNKPVAIIIPAKDRATLTAQTIETIYENTTVPFRMVICDDTSNPEAAASLQRLYREYDFKLLVNEENLGITPTKMRCIKALDFPFQYFYVTDNDYWYRKGWLKLLIEKLEKYEDIKIIGGTTYPLHKVLEVREDVVITQIHTGGTMLMKKETLDLILKEYPNWTQDWNVSKLIQDNGGKVGHLANPLFCLHCGVMMVSGRLDEIKTIQGKKHVGAEAYLKTLADQVGAKYE